ncbi:hypothetical protein D3C73_1381590 [compost metagenome]
MPGQLRLAPVTAPDHALLGHHRFGDTPLGEQRVAAAAVQPMLLAVQRLVNQATHARGERPDSQVQAVVLHAKLQLIGAGYRKVQVHCGVLLAVGSDRFSQRQRAVAHG